jgi:hypothetical protein
MTEDERYWFENVPEVGRYWAVVQMGIPQSRAEEPEPDFKEGAFSNDLEAVEEIQEVNTPPARCWICTGDYRAGTGKDRSRRVRPGSLHLAGSCRRGTTRHRGARS